MFSSDCHDRQGHGEGGQSPLGEASETAGALLFRRQRGNGVEGRLRACVTKALSTMVPASRWLIRSRGWGESGARSAAASLSTGATLARSGPACLVRTDLDKESLACVALGAHSSVSECGSHLQGGVKSVASVRSS